MNEPTAAATSFLTDNKYINYDKYLEPKDWDDWKNGTDLNKNDMLFFQLLLRFVQVISVIWLRAGLLKATPTALPMKLALCMLSEGFTIWNIATLVGWLSNIHQISVVQVSFTELADSRRGIYSDLLGVGENQSYPAGRWECRSRKAKHGLLLKEVHELFGDLQDERPKSN